MHRFLDNSYIQSIGNCVQRRATSIEQVETFIRFLGEVLLAERFSFTNDPREGVAPVSSKAIQTIASVVGNEVQFEHTPMDEWSLELACDRVAHHMAAEIGYISRKDILSSALSAYPNFNDNVNPHELLHEILVNPMISWRRKASFNKKIFGSNSSANIAPKVILTEEVLNTIAPLVSNKTWTVSHTLHLTIAARSLAYDYFAENISSTYLPSSGRAALHRIDSSVQVLSAKDLGEDDLFRTDGVKRDAMPGLINAIIRVSHGDPAKSLALAVAVRKDTKRLRTEFLEVQQDLQSDACLIESQSLHRAYQDVVSTIVKGAKPPSMKMAFNLNFVLLGIPSISIDLDKLETWYDFKRKEKKVKRIATVLLMARRLPLESPFELLKEAALVSK